MSRDLHEIRAERKQTHPDNRGVDGGDIEAVAAPEDADQYVIIKKRKTPGDQKKED